MKNRKFRKGEVLFEAGSPGTCMYEIRSGLVGIYAARGTADEKKLTELGAGRSFGEMALIEESTRSAAAVALEDTEVLEITLADFQAYLEERPEKLVEIMRGLNRRIRELTRDYMAACQTIGEWRDTSELGQKKENNLFAKLRRLAEIFEESMRYMNSSGEGIYYMRDAFMD